MKYIKKIRDKLWKINCQDVKMEMKKGFRNKKKETIEKSKKDIKKWRKSIGIVTTLK